MNLRHLAAQRRATDNVVASATRTGGRLQRDDAIDALVAWLAKSSDPLLRSTMLRKAAQQLLDDHGERYNPRRRCHTTGFYHPNYWLKLGGGLWVRMGHATQTDLNAWSNLSYTNRVQVDDADDRLQSYADSRDNVFRHHRDLHILHEVEQRAFNYQGSIHDVLDDVDDGFDGTGGLWIPNQHGC